MPLISFDTPWKHQKTSGFVMISEGIERDQWHEWVKANRYNGMLLIAIIRYEREFKTLWFVVIRAVLIWNND